jgi:hypothetical protein
VAWAVFGKLHLAAAVAAVTMAAVLESMIVGVVEVLHTLPIRE